MTDPKTDAVPTEEQTPPSGGGEGSVVSAEEIGDELAKLSSELDERTNDLKRVTAEYANYRKRVDRDRRLVADQATISVITGLLPVLDDLDRARSHGDLNGPFASVAEQLTGALGRLGLVGFGEKGDAFDPNRHEAVAHMLSPEVTAPTCIDVMRRGYELGDRLVRAALVAVADPVEMPAEPKKDEGEKAAAEKPESAEPEPEPESAEVKDEAKAEPAAEAKTEDEVKSEVDESTKDEAAEPATETAAAEEVVVEEKPKPRPKPSPHPRPKPPPERAPEVSGDDEAGTESGSGEQK